MTALVTKHLPLVTKHLPLVAGAPDGIKKLRELILDLAVSGKLVPQAQEPTAIEKHSPQNDASEAAALRSSADADYTPFPTPSEWGWKKLGDIAVIERGGSPRPIKSFLTTASDGLNWIKIGDTEKGGKYITSASEKIRPEGLAKTRMVYPGDFLLTNSMSFGRPYITQIEGCIHDGWLRISPPDSLDRDYLYALLSSQYVRRFFVNAAAGAVVMNLNADKVRELPVPLPPLAEQHRIVAKVDELMALCDRLEADQADAEAAHAQLVQALLDSLTQASDAADFRASWQRLSEHFHTLFTTEASIDALKQTVLRLGFMGKLVPQIDPASDSRRLLDAIAIAKAQQTDSGRLRLSDESKPAMRGDVPFHFPPEWQVARMADLCEPITSGSTPPSSETNEREGIPFLKVYNIREQRIDFDYKRQFVNEAFHLAKMKRSALKPNDVVMNIVGPPLGKTAIIPDEYPNWNCNQAIVFFRLVDPMSPRFVHLFLCEGSFLEGIELIGTAGQDNVSVTKSRNIVVPVPTEAEQHRIVAKVDELMALCDQLKAQLTEARQQHAQLASVLVEQAVA